jgi:hypothetical protein
LGLPVLAQPVFNGGAELGGPFVVLPKS